MMPKIFTLGYKISKWSVVVLGIIVAVSIINHFLIDGVEMTWMAIPKKFFLGTFYFGLVLLVVGGVCDRIRNRW